MTEHCARSILRLLAVAIIMVGLCMAAFSLVNLVGASRAMSGMQSLQAQMSGAVAQLGVSAIVADMAVSSLGCVLFGLSPSLAAKIVG